MPRPLTPLQAHENGLFLEALARSGNARMAAREVGRPANSFHYRRKRHAGFAQGWDAAVAASHARLHLAGGKRGPSFDRLRMSGRKSFDKLGTRGEDFRTKGGEPMVVRTRGGKLQIRLAHPDKLTKACEQAFLYALSATANVRLSAAAARASSARAGDGVVEGYGQAGASSRRGLVRRLADRGHGAAETGPVRLTPS